MIKSVWVLVNFIGLALLPTTATAHVSEGGFVLLLPTEIYIASGILAVALTVLALTIVPARIVELLVRPKLLVGVARLPELTWLSWLSFLVFIGLVIIGFLGEPNPLGNPLPLAIWTIWWLALPLIQGLVGDFWQFINPWIGPYRLLKGKAPLLVLPERLGLWPAIFGLVLFASFMLADPAPDAPARLALIVGYYWLLIFALMLIFGESWLSRGEFYTCLMQLIAKLASFQGSIAMPGWQLLAIERSMISMGAMALAFLAIGSFDGLNETFLWLSWIGINPLEFPGRSAVIAQTIAGLLATHLVLFAVFALCVWLGFVFAGHGQDWTKAIWPLALTTLPIAFAYHFAHYLVAFLINSQYVAVALTDPFHDGSDFFGLGEHFVSTGFLNSKASVEVIYQAQAGAVVLGHVLAVFLAHATALRFLGNHRQAVISQIPLALFMLGYTFLGLWLLATAKGA